MERGLKPMAGESTDLSIMAKLVLGLAAALIISAVIWHGISAETIHRAWRDLFDRSGGPMSFRFFLQPTMAAIAALHDGIKDAMLGRSPYFWTVLHNAEKRRGRIREGLNSTARIILLGLGMDLIYQLKVFGTFYPAEALGIALALALVPYLLLRGPIARVARLWTGRPENASP
jgi:hypothetical protein